MEIYLWGSYSIIEYSNINENIISLPAIVAAPQVGPDPASITCPSCQKHIVTRLDYETSTKTHIFAGLLCLFM